VAKAPLDIRSLARQHTHAAIGSLARIAADGESEAARVAACCALLDRGWGRAPQAHTGEDGEGDIRVTIRHIVQGIAAQPQLEANNNVVHIIEQREQRDE